MADTEQLTVLPTIEEANTTEQVDLQIETVDHLRFEAVKQIGFIACGDCPNPTGCAFLGGCPKGNPTS